MNVNYIKTLQKDQLLNLFTQKDSGDNKVKRHFFSDVFYDFSLWPINSIRDFWLLRHVNRMRITNFCFGNGLSLHTFIEMIVFYHGPSTDNSRRITEMTLLWDRLKNGIVPHYYYYNMEMKFDIYFGGQKRQNGQPAGPVVVGNLFNSLDQSRDDGTFFMKPRQYAELVKSRVEHAEHLKYEERQAPIKRGERRKQIEKSLQFLKLESVHDLLTDSEDSDDYK